MNEKPSLNFKDSKVLGIEKNDDKIVVKTSSGDFPLRKGFEALPFEEEVRVFFYDEDVFAVAGPSGEVFFLDQDIGPDDGVEKSGSQGEMYEDLTEMALFIPLMLICVSWVSGKIGMISSGEVYACFVSAFLFLLQFCTVHDFKVFFSRHKEGDCSTQAFVLKNLPRRK